MEQANIYFLLNGNDRDGMSRIIAVKLLSWLDAASNGLYGAVFGNREPNLSSLDRGLLLRIFTCFCVVPREPERCNYFRGRPRTSV